MAEEWGGLEGTFVTSLKTRRIEPVPDPIIKLAQLSLDGRKVGTDDNGADVIRHAMERKFETPERAQAFARHMRNAGDHTNPASSVTVLVDPERTKVQKNGEDGKPLFAEDGKAVMEPGPAVDPTLVRWRAGARRGKTPAA